MTESGYAVCGGWSSSQSKTGFITTERAVTGALSFVLGRNAEKPILYPNRASS